MRQTRAGFQRAMRWFRQEYEDKEGILSIEEGTVTRPRRGGLPDHWLYAIMVKVQAGTNLKLPKLWNGFNVVEERVDG